MLRSLRPVTVLSFMSQWGGGSSNHQLQKSPPSATASPGPSSPPPSPLVKQPADSASFSQSATALNTYNSERASPTSAQLARSDSRVSARPMSMIQTYQPPVMEVSQDTLPELQRIFMFLNSHSNKLYQEGYFLKFHDTDARTSKAVQHGRFVALTVLQVAALRPTASGKSTLSSSWAPSSPFGMRVRWTQQAAMPKSCQPSSTSQTLQSTWCVCS